MADTESRAGDHGRDRHTAPGSRLRDERLRRDMTVDTVAQSLHLNRATIEALEHNDFDALPPMTFVRGYLRAYCHLLALDADAVIASLSEAGVLDEATPLSARVGGDVGPAPRRPAGSGQMKSLSGIAVVLAVVLAGVVGGTWWLTQQADEAPVAPEPGVEESAGGVIDSAPDNATGSAPDRAPETTEPNNEPGVPDAAPEPAQVPSAPSTPTTSLASDSELAERALADAPPIDDSLPELASPTPAETAAEDAATEAEADDATLAFSFSGESWMEVSDVGGERLLFGLQTEGEERVTGEPPFEIVIGDVESVTVEFQGEPVDLDTYARGNVARFTLGDS